MRVKQADSIEPLGELKHLYMQQATDPLDGMWLCGFVPMATHYGFHEENELAGFCCVNDEGYLLQFFVSPRYQHQSSALFDSVALRADSPAGVIKGAFVSTAEPHYLSLCLDHFSAFEVNALMYQLDGTSGSSPKNSREPVLSMMTMSAANLPEAIDFAVAAIGAPEEWLNGYYAGLIERGELFGLWEGGRLIATGESRGYDQFQTDYADLGVIVGQSVRGRGLATQILKDLVAMNERKGLKPICSTERENIAAQKAIVRAGFFARNRIIQFNAPVERAAS